MILITGVNGFVGRHLAREVYGRDIKVCGVGVNEHIPDEQISSVLTDYYKCDITDRDQVSSLPLRYIDAVINLAGLAAAGPSFSNPDLYMQVNTRVLSVLGEALFRANPKARMIAVSTGALYDPDQEMPLSEDAHVVEQGSPYALSKLAMEKAAKDLREKGQDCVVARPFNHIGPGQGPGFLIPDLIAKLRKYKEDGSPITAGNLKTIRDYSDVRDIARAYASLATADKLNADLYNVCSGVGHSGEEIMKTICGEMDIAYSQLEVEVDQSLIRPTDPTKIVGDHSRISKDTGWQPTFELAQTIRDIIRT